MRYLVTGGTGFIGSNLAKKLIEDGHDVYVTGFEKDSVPLGSKYLGENFTYKDWSSIGPIDAVFHQAANNDTLEIDKEKMFEANVENSKKLFENALANGCKKIIYASSTAVYGNMPAPYHEDGPTQPLNVYAESKLALDVFAMEFAKNHPDILIVGLRYCNVYGPGETKKGKRASMIPQLAEQMQNNERPKIFKNGEQLRDYIYVRDVVRANILALNATRSTILNCGGGKATSFNELVQILNEVLGTSLKPEYIDNPYTTTYQTHTECDISRAKTEIAFVPEFDIQSGIQDYYKGRELSV